MRLGRATTLCAVLLWKVAIAAPAEEAAVHVDRGAALFGKGDFEGALGEFEAAYRLSGSWKVLIHVGVTEARLRRYAEALRTLERYLSLGGAEVPEATRAAVQRELQGIRALLAEVTVVVEGGPAEVEVNGRPVGRAPLRAPILLGPGEHTFRAQRAGFEPAVQRIKLASGMRREVRLLLRAQPGTLSVDTRPPGALVIVDGREVGRSPWEERLGAGQHQVQARLPGHLPASSLVVLDRGGTRRLSLELLAEPPPPRKPWYRRWYVWTLIGGAIAAGVVTTAVVVTRPQYSKVLEIPPP